MRAYRSDFVWGLLFELVFLVDMMMVAPIGYPLEDSISILLGLALGNYFDAWEGYFVGFSLVSLAELVIGDVEVYLVGLSLVLPLGSPLESPNPGADFTGMLIGELLGLWFGYEVCRYSCFCHRLMDFLEANFWGVGVYCVPPSGPPITSNINSVIYCQLLEFLTLALSPIWLIPYSVGR